MLHHPEPGDWTPLQNASTLNNVLPGSLRQAWCSMSEEVILKMLWCLNLTIGSILLFMSVQVYCSMQHVCFANAFHIGSMRQREGPGCLCAIRGKASFCRGRRVPAAKLRACPEIWHFCHKGAVLTDVFAQCLNGSGDGKSEKHCI